MTTGLTIACTVVVTGSGEAGGVPDDLRHCCGVI